MRGGEGRGEHRALVSKSCLTRRALHVGHLPRSAHLKGAKVNWQFSVLPRRWHMECHPRSADNAAGGRNTQGDRSAATAAPRRET